MSVHFTIPSQLSGRAGERRLCLTFSSLLSWQQAHQQQTVYTSQSGRHPRRMLYLRRMSLRSFPPLPANHCRCQSGLEQLPGRLQGIALQARWPRAHASCQDDSSMRPGENDFGQDHVSSHGRKHGQQIAPAGSMHEP